MNKCAEGAAAILILLAGCGLAGASDDGIPALLKFAERQQAPAVKPAAPAPRAEPGAARPGNASPPAGDSLRLTTLNQTLRQQAETIRRLERQLAERKALPAPPPKITEIDIRPLARALQGLRQAMAPAPELGALAASLAQAEQQRAALAGQLAQQQQREAARVRRLEQQLAARQKAAEPPALTSAADKQAYAAGVSLGRDILQLQRDNRQLGLTVDRPRLLAGIADTLAGSQRLDDAAIDSALQAADRAMEQAQRRRSQDGKAYLADFAQRPGVQKDALGFYYRVDYAGSGRIGAADRVDIVVRESLPGGQVIKDMELAGTVISQPLAQYPPLFRAAIGKLQKHGSMTLVVPPALAYGDRGSPPAIPPGATMIYTLRVADVLPPSGEAQK
ncbi:FKBP-type peptidyl-prolyl cis-trans isomerase N-terminal domain-containing protein [Serratia ficaria]|uniref:peptidylprolyl isomerase n=1 Tax=Serratia ficaria TaxID=61651 RepID=A0A240CDK1_SERFI|nr:FKBP-type peptidyl-prolyl cis-trans isomerase N-terminal domain-containing protein [Serratia ficaria]REF42329.1 FKBP-type peptidyl-prolyl cis-trans isomerase FkpA [Serratia ficaria]CAI1132914.1 FKBP-type peptidyl-prolyl cis-trans isomerase fkpA precursor [Serratia ficaria]CAI1152708.1 FKBP-type peptidyl-prolyl cis-trans isomerase fkpA precursor [Serratia ficaria]CAI1163029.1 FKBP-type peptidyl-prolyl cis-trans isomerase fkpA precursor [Serratia ficaria]CAI1950881.1 FKBP-type peptidyl-prolyl